MSTHVISFSEEAQRHVDATLADGSYADISEYVSVLIERDSRKRREATTKLPEMIFESDYSGSGERSLD